MPGIRPFYRFAFILCLLFNSSSFAQTPTPTPSDRNFPLAADWSLQSSARVGQAGDEISTPRFQPRDWYTVSVPATVVAALVKQKVYPDPYFGMNLRQLPGVTYPIGAEFSKLPMALSSPFAVPWWYRKEFVLPAGYKGRVLWLNFRGINYRANIWLNGKRVANLDQVAGAWRTYEFNITDLATPGAVNVLAVEVFAPTDTDLAITFVDWNPTPPDKSMGLWRQVYIAPTGPVALRYPAVITHLDSPQNTTARLTVTAQVKNGTNRTVKGTLKAKIDGIADFAQDVELKPGESKDVSFEADKFPQLTLRQPRLWWPAQMGTPNLYHLGMQFEVNGDVSDLSDTQFGIREVTSEVNGFGRVFSVNGKRILIRGAGWAPDLMLREDSTRLQDELRYVRDLGLNTIRLEGKLETEEFFNLADREGILIMAGWCCCDHWEHWSKWAPQDYDIAKASLTDQIYRLRAHPSLIAWLNASDGPPPPDVEEMYLAVEKQLRWPNPLLSSAAAEPTSVTGDSGVKMTGPYEYVAPSYWTQDAASSSRTYECKAGGCGGAYGFNTETSPGPAVPPLESLRRFIPSDHLWPIDEYWNYHAGGGEFKTIQVYTDAQNARYGKSGSAEEFSFKSQLMNYEGIRAMYEAYSRNKYTSTGVIQWMLNNGWPAIIWNLYDYYLRPAGGYFGAKKALEALHPLYSYADHSVWVVSSQYQDAKGLKLTARIFNLDMTEKFSRDSTLDAPADSTSKILELPAIPDLSPVYFLALKLTGASGKLVGTNFYWLSAKPETLDWEQSNWWMTPTATFADFTALSRLPKVRLKVASRTEQQGKDSITHVIVENPSQSLAFFVRLKVNKGAGGEEILPVLWQDNYFSLLPGEKREVTATYRAAELGTAQPAVEAKGWNVQ